MPRRGTSSVAIPCHRWQQGSWLMGRLASRGLLMGTSLPQEVLIRWSISGRYLLVRGKAQLNRGAIKAVGGGGRAGDARTAGPVSCPLPGPRSAGTRRCPATGAGCATTSAGCAGEWGPGTRLGQATPATPACVCARRRSRRTECRWAALLIQCAACGAQLPPSAHFCGGCGRPLT